MAFNILGLFKPVADLVDNLHTSKEEKLELKAKIDTIASNAQAQILNFINKMAEKQAAIIVAEATSEDKWVRRWRPIMMYVIIAIVANNYLLIPWLQALGWNGAPVIILPEKVWTLMEIGLGGYIVGRSGEKIADKWIRDKKG